MLFDIYPDNEAAVAVFLALQTQWRVISGMARVVYQGIDYSAVPAVLSLMAIPRADRGESFVALRVMESAALRVLNAPKDDDG